MQRHRFYALGAKPCQRRGIGFAAWPRLRAVPAAAGPAACAPAESELGQCDLDCAAVGVSRQPGLCSPFATRARTAV